MRLASHRPSSHLIVLSPTARRYDSAPGLLPVGLIGRVALWPQAHSPLVRQAGSSSGPEVPDLIQAALCQLHREVDGIGCRDRTVYLILVVWLDIAELDVSIVDIGYVVPGQAQGEAGVFGIDVG